MLSMPTPGQKPPPVVAQQNDHESTQRHAATNEQQYRRPTSPVTIDDEADAATIAADFSEEETDGKTPVL